MAAACVHPFTWSPLLQALTACVQLGVALTNFVETEQLNQALPGVDTNDPQRRADSFSRSIGAATVATTASKNSAGNFHGQNMGRVHRCLKDMDRRYLGDNADEEGILVPNGGSELPSDSWIRSIVSAQQGWSPAEWNEAVDNGHPVRIPRTCFQHSCSHLAWCTPPSSRSEVRDRQCILAGSPVHLGLLASANRIPVFA